MLTHERGKTMGVAHVYLLEILMDLTLEPTCIITIATNKLLQEKSPFSRAGHISQKKHRWIKCLPRRLSG